MPYNLDKDTQRLVGGTGLLTFGAGARAVTPSDSTDLDPYARTVVVLQAGSLRVLPVLNADNAPITFVDCPVGFTPPYRIRRVFATGTTATVATVDG